MGNLCGTLEGSQSLHGQPFTITVEKASGSSGDSQLRFLSGLLGENFPAARVRSSDLPSASPDFFEVKLGTSVLHSSVNAGPIQNFGTVVVEKIRTAAAEMAQAGLSGRQYLLPGNSVAVASTQVGQSGSQMF